MNFLSSRQAKIVLLVGILLLGFVLRAYNFSPWLHFELDQARDARIVDDGLRGDFLDLPLLGPKAGGTTLRLPPAFYYLEYLSAEIFGGSPAGMATLGMLLSVATIGVFFLLVKRYFPTPLVFGLTLLLAVSEFFVMYGRFAWNPNLIPFFLIFGWYALLRAVDHEEARKGYWFVLAAGSLALAMQFHFLAFVSIPVITGLFLLIRRPRFSFKIWLGALLLVALLYLPMFLNESQTGFANAQAFVRAVTEKSGKDDHSLLEKSIEGFSEHALYGLVVTTGYEGATFPRIVIGTKEGKAIGWACDARCDKGKWYGVAAVVLFGFGLLTLLVLWWKESVRHRSDFLLLTLLWFGTTFLLFLPLAYDMVPRFFLVSGPIFFILIGLMLSLLPRFCGNRRGVQGVVFLVVALFALSNITSLSERFRELSLAATEAVDSPPDRILKERIRVTLEQQEQIVSFLEYRSQETGYPVYMWSEPQHRRALKYLIEKRGIENAVLGIDGVYQEGVYYIILRAQSDIEDALKKYHFSYTVGATTSFGTLVAIELFPKQEAVKAVRQDFSKPKPNDSQGLPRYTWREFFQRQQATTTDDDHPEEADEADETL